MKPKNFWIHEMFGNDFLCNMASNVRNLFEVFDEIYQANSSIVCWVLRSITFLKF